MSINHPPLPSNPHRRNVPASPRLTLFFPRENPQSLSSSLPHVRHRSKIWGFIRPHFKGDRHPMGQIQYSEKYLDDTHEYRHMVLPQEVAKFLPKNRLLSEHVGEEPSQSSQDQMDVEPPCDPNASSEQPLRSS